MDTEIDPATGNDLGAQNLAKAIRQRESGGNFNATGDAGTSKGGYQFQAKTWKSYAKDVLGDENADMTPDNQNAVAYGKIKKWKDDGKNAAQIAAMWNAGEGIGDNWVNHKGETKINGQVIQYDTPQYVKDVTDLYQQYKGQTPTQNSQSPETERKSFTESIPSNYPESKESTGAGKLIRGLINSSGVPSLIASGINAEQLVRGKPETDTFHNGYLGDVSRVGKGFDPAKGFFGKENKENRQAVEDSVKKGVGLATTLSAGEGILNAGKTIATKGVKGLLQGADIMGSPAVVKNLKNVGLKNPIEDFKAFNNAEKVEMLTEAMKNAGTVDQKVIQQALDKVLPQAIKEAGGKVAFSKLHPALAKIPSIIKTLAGLGTNVGILEAVNKLNRK